MGRLHAYAFPADVSAQQVALARLHPSPNYHWLALDVELPTLCIFYAPKSKLHKLRLQLPAMSSSSSDDEHLLDVSNSQTSDGKASALWVGICLCSIRVLSEESFAGFARKRICEVHISFTVLP